MGGGRYHGGHYGYGGFHGGYYGGYRGYYGGYYCPPTPWYRYGYRPYMPGTTGTVSIRIGYGVTAATAAATTATTNLPTSTTYYRHQRRRVSPGKAVGFVSAPGCGYATDDAAGPTERQRHLPTTADHPTQCRCRRWICRRSCRALCPRPGATCRCRAIEVAVRAQRRLTSTRRMARSRTQANERMNATASRFF